MKLAKSCTCGWPTFTSAMVGVFKDVSFENIEDMVICQSTLSSFCWVRREGGGGGGRGKGEGGRVGQWISEIDGNGKLTEANACRKNFSSVLWRWSLVIALLRRSFSLTSNRSRPTPTSGLPKKLSTLLINSCRISVSENRSTRSYSLSSFNVMNRCFPSADTQSVTFWWWLRSMVRKVWLPLSLFNLMIAPGPSMTFTGRQPFLRPCHSWAVKKGYHNIPTWNKFFSQRYREQYPVYVEREGWSRGEGRDWRRVGVGRGYGYLHHINPYPRPQHPPLKGSPKMIKVNNWGSTGLKFVCFSEYRGHR